MVCTALALVSLAASFIGAVDGGHPTLPQLLPSTDTHVHHSEHTLDLMCRGTAPLSWTLPSRNLTSDGVWTNDVDCSHGVWSHCSQLLLRNLTHRDTGLYSCSYTGLPEESAATYVFVKDDQRPFVDQSPSGPDSVFVSDDDTGIVVPCRTTSPDINVTLLSTPPMAESAAEAVTWDPKVGFWFPYTKYTYYSMLHCLAHARGNLVEYSYLVVKQSSSLWNVRLHPEKISLLQGDTLQLTCSGDITYNGRIAFTWNLPKASREYVKKTTMDTPSKLYTMYSTITLRNVTHEDQGRYQCTARVMTNQQVAATEVIVFEHPFLELSPKGSRVITVLVGHKLQILEPLVKAFPLPDLVKWYKDGVSIKENSTCYKLSGYKLIIEEVKIKHAGVFTIFLRNSEKGLFQSLSYTLVVQVAPVMLEEEVPDSNVQPYLLGKEYHLTCSATGVPAPHITWFWEPCDPSANLTKCDLKNSPIPIQVEKGKQNITDGTRLQNKINDIIVSHQHGKGKNKTISTLVVAAAAVSGRYHCSASNEMLDAEGGPRRLQTKHRSYPFFVAGHPDPVEVLPQNAIDGGNVTLTCQATRYMYTQLRWYDSQNRSVPAERTMQHVSRHSISLSLLLSNVSQKHGHGYECQAKGEQRLVRKAALLNIAARSAPQLHRNLTNQEVNSSNTLTLVCQAYGVPLPLITWWKNGLRVKEGPGISLSREGQLTIERVKAEDQGLYECLATNEEGSVKTAALITIVGGEARPNIEVIILACTGVAAAFLWLMLVLFIRRVRKLDTPESDSSYTSIILPLDEQCELLPYDGNKWEFPRDRLRLGKTLGHGAFGKVVEASAFGIDKMSTCKTVAVKMLKAGASNNECKALMSELKILIHIGHHLNVVNLLGACTRPGGALMIIVEYCKYGNLSNHLRNKRGDFVFKSREGKPAHSGSGCDLSEIMKRRLGSVASTGSSASSGFVEDKSYCDSEEEEEETEDLSKRSITMEDLICYSFQVAKGMEFLASRKCIHRDLAARNILLSENNVVKICDFGLARDIYKDPDYVRKGDARLPLKWMAPEAIFDKVYTMQSDVWSFGVLMWEIFSMGASPYPGVQIDEEFCCKLKEGTRMRAPEYSTHDIYQTMLDCWQGEPNSRPTFTQLVERLGDLLQANVQRDGKHYIPLSAALLKRGSRLSSSAMPEETCTRDSGRIWVGKTKTANVKTFKEVTAEKGSERVPEGGQSDSGLGLSSDGAQTLQRIESLAPSWKDRSFIKESHSRTQFQPSLSALDLYLEEKTMKMSLDGHSPPPDYNYVMRYSAPPV